MFSADIDDEFGLLFDDVNHSIVDLTISFIDGRQLIRISYTRERPFISDWFDQAKPVIITIILVLLSNNP